MEAILRFNLNDTDDRQAHKRANKATDMAQLIWDLCFDIRGRMEEQIEHAADKGTPLDAWDTTELFFSELERLLDEYDITIEELIR